MKNVLKIVLVVIIALLTGLLIHIFISRADAADETTQTYTATNYAILAAEINVSSNNNSSNTRKVMLRTNTRTGQCWILELTVHGTQNFRVAQAHWREIPAIPRNPDLNI